MKDMSALMDSADLYLTKPGGLSTSEALAKALPMVLFEQRGDEPCGSDYRHTPSDRSHCLYIRNQHCHCPRCGFELHRGQVDVELKFLKYSLNGTMEGIA